MRKTLLIATPLFLLFALVAGSATRGSPDLSKPGTIRVTTRGVEDQYVDRGLSGLGPGDLRITRQLVYNPSITPKAIGHSDLVCTYTASYARQCSGTFTLPQGKIVVAGTVTFRQFYELAVIGGTGLYDNVRGSLTVTLVKRNPQREVLIFRLLV